MKYNYEKGIIGSVLHNFVHFLGRSNLATFMARKFHSVYDGELWRLVYPSKVLVWFKFKIPKIWLPERQLKNWLWIDSSRWHSMQLPDQRRLALPGLLWKKPLLQVGPRTVPTQKLALKLHLLGITTNQLRIFWRVVRVRRNWFGLLLLRRHQLPENTQKAGWGGKNLPGLLGQ